MRIPKLLNFLLAQELLGGDSSNLLLIVIYLLDLDIGCELLGGSRKELAFDLFLNRKKYTLERL
jgi:hypothetical protein